MITHKATRIAIIAEKLLQENITRIVEDAGATGYSVYDGGGKGAHGAYPFHRPAVADGFAIVKIEVVVSDRAVAMDIAEKVTTTYFETYSGIIYLDEIEVFRPAKF